jgi:hypothetical protein
MDEKAKQLKRILRLSKLNAYSVAVIAGTFGLLCVVLLELGGVIVGAGVTAAGLMEIRGHRRLQAGERGARSWMVGSQVWLIVCVLAYCGWRLAAFDPADPLAVLGDAELLKSTAESALIPQGMLEDLVTRVYTLTYRLVAVATLVLQGGLAAYYWVKVGRLEAASTDPAP